MEICADVSTVEEAKNAEHFGVDYISSTLIGYTSYTKDKKIPNFKILEKFEKFLTIPYIAEGGFSNNDEINKALELGVHGIVIGTAITRPHILIQNFNQTIEDYYERNKIKK